MFIERPLLLSLSTIANLREVRRRVLSTRYLVLSLANLDELKALPPGGAFELLVLCHSLSREECVESIAVARRQWPGIPTLRIAAPFSPCRAEDVDASVGALAGPFALFEEIDHLLAARHARPGAVANHLPGHYAS